MQNMPELVRVGPFADKLSGRIAPGTGASNPTQLLLDGVRAKSRYELARHLAGKTYDALSKEQRNRLDEAMLLPWSIAGDDVLRYLAAAGLDLRVDQKVLHTIQQAQTRADYLYPRWSQGEEGWEYDPGTIPQVLQDEGAALLRSLGWYRYGHNATHLTDEGATRENSLFSFSFSEICRIWAKRDNLMAWFMGGSKTRSGIALGMMHQATDAPGPIIVLGLRRHLQAWLEEIPTLTPVRDRLGITNPATWIEKNDRPDLSSPILCMSVDRLKRLSEPEWQRLLSVASTGCVVLDEAYIVRNSDSAQAKAVMRLMAATRHNAGLSGTPYRGMPDDAHFVLSSIFRPRSIMFPYYAADRQGGKRLFDADFVSFAVSEDQASRKKVPILKNPEKFTTMLRPLMSRMVRNQPDVIEVLGDIQLEVQKIPVMFDPVHQAFYEAVLEQFRAWWKWKLEMAGELNKMLTNEILVKLGYVIRAMCQPWMMETPEDAIEVQEILSTFKWKFPAFTEGPTAIHKWIAERAIQSVVEGKQVLIGGRHTAQLNMLQKYILDHGITAGLYHGGVDFEKRNDAIKSFRSGVSPILIGSYGTIAESANLPEATEAYCLEPDWNSTVIDQFGGRITRGIVETQPIAYHVFTPGSIFEYMYEWADLKRGSLRAGLDGIAQNVKGEDLLDLGAFLKAVLIPGNAKADNVRQRRFFIDEGDDAV
jgi:Helicase conserved C-terminal domain/SNF2-related domain